MNHSKLANRSHQYGSETLPPLFSPVFPHPDSPASLVLRICRFVPLHFSLLFHALLIAKRQ